MEILDDPRHPEPEEEEYPIPPWLWVIMSPPIGAFIYGVYLLIKQVFFER